MDQNNLAHSDPGIIFFKYYKSKRILQNLSNYLLLILCLFIRVKSVI